MTHRQSVDSLPSRPILRPSSDINAVMIELTDDDFAGFDKLATRVAFVVNGAPDWRNAAAGDRIPPSNAECRPARRRSDGAVGALCEWGTDGLPTSVGFRDLLADAGIQAFLDTLPAIILVQDIQDRIAFINKAGVDVLNGPSRSELIGRDKLDCVPPALRLTVEASDREAWSAGGLIIRAQGDARDGLRILTYKHVIRDAAGEHWLIAASLDIAELDRTLDELAARSGALENEVRLRTGELETALEQAKAADRAKSEFLATMSHELRTPLNAILGFGQILSTGVAEPRSVEYGKLIARAGGHLTALINDILDYTRMETGSLILEFERFAPADILREVVGLLADEAEAKGVALDAVYDGAGDVALLGDPRRVRQVLLNLLSNALKFTDFGSVHASCAVSLKDAGVIGVEFRVIDTGRGIDENAGDRIFDPFNDVHNRVRSATPGTGLGLAISRRLAEMMGGSIGYASERGAGSTFIFTLEGDAC